LPTPLTPVPSSLLCLRLQSDGRQHHLTTVVTEALDPRASSESVASFLITVPRGVPAFTFTVNVYTFVWVGLIVPVHATLLVAVLR